MLWCVGIDSWLRKLGGVVRARRRDSCLGCWPGFGPVCFGCCGCSGYARDCMCRLHRRKFGRHCASVVSEEAAPFPFSERGRQAIGDMTRNI